MDEEFMGVVRRVTETLEDMNNALESMTQTLKEMEWNQRTK